MSFANHSAAYDPELSVSDDRDDCDSGVVLIHSLSSGAISTYSSTGRSAAVGFLQAVPSAAGFGIDVSTDCWRAYHAWCWHRHVYSRHP
jgi:hypothetical protein